MIPSAWRAVALGLLALVVPASPTAVAAGSVASPTAWASVVPGTFLSKPTDDLARAVAVQADGKILVAGTSSCIDSYCTYGALARFGRNGRLDPTFGAAGQVGGTSAGLSEVRAVAVQADGTIVAGGVLGATGAPGDGRGGRFGLARFLPDGRLDPSFGNAGLVETEFCPEPSAGAVNALAIQPDGRIVAAGFSRCRGNRALAIARYLGDGSLDPSFRGGWLALDAGRRLDEDLRSVALQPDGRILMAGGVAGNFLLFRLTASGRVDSSFGDGGNVETSLTARRRGHAPRRIKAVASAVTVDRHGRILVAGGRDGVTDAGAVARYLPSGRLDRRFGRRGIARTPRFASAGLAVDRCGALHLAGSHSPRRHVSAFALATLGRDGSHAGGTTWLTVPDGLGREATATALATWRRTAFAVGSARTLSGYRRFAVVRLPFGSGAC